MTLSSLPARPGHSGAEEIEEEITALVPVCQQEAASSPTKMGGSSALALWPWPTLTIATTLFLSFWLVPIAPDTGYHERPMGGWKRVGELLFSGCRPDISGTGAGS